MARAQDFGAVGLVKQDERLHSLDNLRALAMLAGVLFHAALAYSPLMHRYWLTADREQWVWVDAIVWFLHLFRMPLFFTIAGFFAARLVERQGLGGMLHNRARRVLLPLVLFLPLVTVGVGWLAKSAAGSVRNMPPLLAWVGRPETPLVSPSLGHLWFLGYLVIFYLLVWIARTAEWGVPVGRTLPFRPGRILLVAPLLLAPALASVPAPTPAPEGLLPQLWAVVFFGSFFFLGYGLWLRRAILRWLGRMPGRLSAGSLTAYVVYWWLLREGGGDAWLRMLAAVPAACVSVWMTACCLGVGRIWLDVRLGWLQYLAESSYWTYLVHLPVVFAVQLRLLDWAMPWWVKWGISVTVTMTVCLLSYHLVVRERWLGRLLNGTREPRAARLTANRDHGEVASAAKNGTRRLGQG